MTAYIPSPALLTLTTTSAPKGKAIPSARFTGSAATFARAERSIGRQKSWQATPGEDRRGGKRGILLRSERAFYPLFTALWNESRRRKRNRPLWWDLVSGVGALDMRKHAPLQAADMLAWATNRSNGHGDHVALCRGIMHARYCSEWSLTMRNSSSPIRP